MNQKNPANRFRGASRYVLDDIQANKVAAGRLCISNKPLHFVIHFLGDAGF